MFLRWQMRKSVASRHRESPPVRPVALLVESVRIDGKPRQRHVAYLFSIWHGEEDKLGVATGKSAGGWRPVTGSTSWAIG